MILALQSKEREKQTAKSDETARDGLVLRAVSCGFVVHLLSLNCS